MSDHRSDNTLQQIDELCNRPIESRLVLYNISKELNFGHLIRTANAFGVSEIIVVGRRAMNRGGHCRTYGRTRRRHFHRLHDACRYLQDDGFSICGVEIMDQAVSVIEQPFTGSTAFMVGNETIGLTDQQLDHCDHFVYVPQYGTAECLNVNVATSIALQQFANWAGFSETKKQGGVFLSN
jgi:tRNA G18 (ribose-2'-O)-methylase SpoU